MSGSTAQANLPSRRRAAFATLAGAGGSVAINLVQAFLLIPLSLAYLGSHLYGAWLAASELLIWVQLLDLGIPNLLTQRIGAAVGEHDPLRAARWASTGLMLLVGIAAILTGVSIAAAPAISAWAQVPAADAEAFSASFRVGAVASAVLLISNGVVGIARGVQVTGVVSTAQIAGALVGLGASASLLVAGLGIRALALGLLARAVVTVSGAAFFLIRARTQTGLTLSRPSAAVARETGELIPAIAAGNAGYLIANNSELLLVTTMFGPVTGATYALTRRAIDGARALLDSIAWAVSGGFANLVAAADRHRARSVAYEILWLRFGAACLLAAVAVSVNRPFVALLFGPENFGGLALTTAFAAQMILGGQAFLANYLVRAAGPVREGSYLLAAEGVARVLAMAGGLLLFGLVGAPLAAALASSGALVLMMGWLDRTLPESPGAGPAQPGRRVAPVCVVALGLAVASIDESMSWMSVGVVATIVGIAGGGFLWLLAPADVSRISLAGWKRT